MMMELLKMTYDPFVNATASGALAAFVAGMVIVTNIKDVDPVLNVVFQISGAITGLIMMFSICEWGISGIWQIVWVVSFLTQLLVCWAGDKLHKFMSKAVKEIGSKKKEKQ